MLLCTGNSGPWLLECRWDPCSGQDTLVLLFLLGLEDGVPEARRRRLQRHEAGGPRLLGLAAGLLHDQDLGQEEMLKVL